MDLSQLDAVRSRKGFTKLRGGPKPLGEVIRSRKDDCGAAGVVGLCPRVSWRHPPTDVQLAGTGAHT